MQRTQFMEEENHQNHLNMGENCETILQTFAGSTDMTDICEAKVANTLALEADTARQNGLFCDVTLLIGPEKKQFRAHRLILTAGSQYFR